MMKARRSSLLRVISVSLVCLGVVAPLSVFYQELRATVKATESDEARLIREFESFRAVVKQQGVKLIEPADFAAQDKVYRLFLAQFALAPALVTQTGGQFTLINVQQRPAASGGEIVARSANYILREE